MSTKVWTGKDGYMNTEDARSFMKQSRRESTGSTAHSIQSGADSDSGSFRHPALDTSSIGSGRSCEDDTCSVQTNDSMSEAKYDEKWSEADQLEYKKRQCENPSINEIAMMSLTEVKDHGKVERRPGALRFGSARDHRSVQGHKSELTALKGEMTGPPATLDAGPFTAPASPTDNDTSTDNNILQSTWRPPSFWQSTGAQTDPGESKYSQLFGALARRGGPVRKGWESVTKRGRRVLSQSRSQQTDGKTDRGVERGVGESPA